MLIRCTQKLLSELKIKPAVVESPADFFWCWIETGNIRIAGKSHTSPGIFFGFC
jgi:hypothetical protein